MRGKELHVGILLCGIGITPAYAGKSLTASSGNTGRKDHPRVCGEKSIRIPAKTLRARITPAYAGKSDLLWSRQTARGDHPRVCGEKRKGKVEKMKLKGSPPHMRGKEFLNLESLPQLGITPAYAGKRPSGDYSYDHS